MSRYPSNPVTPKVLSEGLCSAGIYSMIGKACPELDKLIDESYTKTDTEKRKEILHKAVNSATDALITVVIRDIRQYPL